MKHVVYTCDRPGCLRASGCSPSTTFGPKPCRVHRHHLNRGCQALNSSREKTNEKGKKKLKNIPFWSFNQKNQRTTVSVRSLQPLNQIILADANIYETKKTIYRGMYKPEEEKIPNDPKKMYNNLLNFKSYNRKYPRS